jgi:hypothetical protein
VEWCASKASTLARLGGMVQRGLGGCGVMDSCREVALSGTVVVSMAGLARLMHGSLF